MSAKAATRLKKIVGELSNIRIADLSEGGSAQSKLEELDTCINEVRQFADVVSGIVGNGLPSTSRTRVAKTRAASRPATRPAARAAAKPKATRAPGRRGRRGAGEFSATPFILNSVQEAGSAGIRPREIVEQVQTAAPGQHVRPSALVSTILTRLKRRGEVKRRAGKWYPK